jgi:CheY-like chemotaxis protein
MLRDHGHRVLEACNGKEALVTYLDLVDEIDIALLDIAMPQLRGDELLLRLRDESPELPVVFCSGRASPLLDQDTLDLKDTWLVCKPFQVDELIQVLDHALASRQVEQLT